jgi:hypothetical protein
MASTGRNHTLLVELLLPVGELHHGHLASHDDRRLCLERGSGSEDGGNRVVLAIGSCGWARRWWFVEDEIVLVDGNRRKALRCKR